MLTSLKFRVNGALSHSFTDNDISKGFRTLEYLDLDDPLSVAGKAARNLGRV